MLVTISADSDEQLTCPYIDSGCIRVRDWQLLAPSLGSLRFFAIGSSEVPVGCPRRESKTNSQSRSSSEGRTSSQICTQTPDPRLSVGLSKLSTNVSAGCSCHPTSADHFRSPRVPFHPVWPTPVARLSGRIRLPGSQVLASRLVQQVNSDRAEAPSVLTPYPTLDGCMPSVIRARTPDEKGAAVTRLYSCRSASIGSNRAARLAGTYPNNTPMAAEKPNARTLI